VNTVVTQWQLHAWSYLPVSTTGRVISLHPQGGGRCGLLLDGKDHQKKYRNKATSSQMCAKARGRTCGIRSTNRALGTARAFVLGVYHRIRPWHQASIRFRNAARSTAPDGGEAAAAEPTPHCTWRPHPRQATHRLHRTYRLLRLGPASE
jgi:hypothetical protein